MLGGVFNLYVLEYVGYGLFLNVKKSRHWQALNAYEQTFGNVLKLNQHTHSYSMYCPSQYVISTSPYNFRLP